MYYQLIRSGSSKFINSDSPLVHQRSSMVHGFAGWVHAVNDCQPSFSWSRLVHGFAGWVHAIVANYLSGLLTACYSHGTAENATTSCTYSIFTLMELLLSMWLTRIYSLSDCYVCDMSLFKQVYQKQQQKRAAGMSSTRLFICVPFLKPFVLLQANVVLSLSLVCDKGKRISDHHLFFRFAVAESECSGASFGFRNERRLHHVSTSDRWLQDHVTVHSFV